MIDATAKDMIVGSRFELERGDAYYPQALTEIKKPPEKLYGIGDPKLLSSASLAVIGARKATPYGLQAAHDFSERAAEYDVVIVSGGALGCDSAAHRGALDAGGKTIVVLGGGCDCIYPKANRYLFQKIVNEGGVLLSERAWSHPPFAYTFRERNRIIAGLARATLIVEAGLPSGTFSTADEALECGKEVWVVPGVITSAASRGANQLIYQGAQPVIDVDLFDDMVVELYDRLHIEHYAEQEHQNKSGDGVARLAADPLLDALLAQPMRLDALVALYQAHVTAQMSQADALTHVMMLLAQYERKRLIARYPDGTYGPCRLVR